MDKVFRNGNQANASKRPLDAPAPTLMFGARSNKVEWMDPALADDPKASGERVTVEQASTLQTYPPAYGGDTSSTPGIKALDLFAGTGWGVACQLLGIEEDGVELMPEAVATREANGMNTIYRDVWDGLLLDKESHEMLYGEYNLLIASPPCQTFSMAGNGAGRAALNEVMEAVRLGAYKDPAALLAFGEKHDLRTALVLSPLAYAYRDRPNFVAFEQVPTVLPVWEECAKVMRDWGYDVKVEVLCAEQYGVPQTRKRAILVARLDGPVSLPVPTHSRYYSRTPEKLDAGVLKWVSMAEALGWGATDQPMHTITGGTHGPADRWASGGSGTRKRLDAKIGTDVWVHNPNRGPVDSRTEYPDRIGVEGASIIQTYPTALRPEIEAWKWKDAPATTVAGDPRITAREHHYHGQQSKTSLKLTFDEAQVLQTYRRPFVWCGTKSKQFLQIGNAVPPLLAHAILSALISE